MQFSKVNQDTYSEGRAYTSPIYGTRNGATPSDPVWNEDGTWNRDLIKLDDRNPIQFLQLQKGICHPRFQHSLRKHRHLERIAVRIDVQL